MPPGISDASYFNPRETVGAGTPRMELKFRKGKEMMVGAGRFELPTSWSQTRRPAAGPRPDANGYMGKKCRWAMVPPERIELSSPAPEAGTLSAELQGHSTIENITPLRAPTTTCCRAHGPERPQNLSLVSPLPRRSIFRRIAIAPSDHATSAMPVPHGRFSTRFNFMTQASLPIR